MVVFNQNVSNPDFLEFGIPESERTVEICYSLAQMTDEWAEWGERVLWGFTMRWRNGPLYAATWYPEHGWWKGSIASSSGSDPGKNHQKGMSDAPIMVTTGTLAPRSLGLFISAKQSVCHSVKTHAKSNWSISREREVVANTWRAAIWQRNKRIRRICRVLRTEIYLNAWKWRNTFWFNRVIWFLVL